VALTGLAPLGLNLRGFSPDWLLILVLFLALRAAPETAYLGAFLFGWAEGYLSLAPPGFFPLKLMIGVLIARGVVRKLEVTGLFPVALLTFILGEALKAGFEPWLLGLVTASARRPFLTAETLILATRASLTTALIAGPVFSLLDSWFKPQGK
jgi:hypothetical protein